MKIIISFKEDGNLNSKTWNEKLIEEFTDNKNSFYKKHMSLCSKILKPLIGKRITLKWYDSDFDIHINKGKLNLIQDCVFSVNTLCYHMSDISFFDKDSQGLIIWLKNSTLK